MAMPSPGDTDRVPRSKQGAFSNPPATADQPLEWVASLTPFRTLDEFVSRLLGESPVTRCAGETAFICQPADCLSPQLFRLEEGSLRQQPVGGATLCETTLRSQLSDLCGWPEASFIRLNEPAADAWWIFQAEVPWRPPAEIVAVVSQLTATALEVQRHFWERRLESIAEFAAGAGHEINNPLGAIIGRAGQLLRAESDPERRRMLETIGSQAYRARDMIGDAMLFARPPQPEPRLLDLSEVIDRVLASFAEVFEERGVTLQREESSGLTVWADETQLTVVVSELLQNAIAAVEPAGEIVFTTRRDPAPGSQRVEFRVTNSGRPLSPEEREHMFDPFYSGRDAGRGLGFGLAKCWRIVQLHGGQIAVESAESIRTSIIVHWPAVDR